MNILSEIEKVDNQVKPIEEISKRDKLVLVVSYQGDEYESFELDREIAKATVTGIMKLMAKGAKLPIIWFLHNKPTATGSFEIGEKVEDFKGIVRIDRDMRAIRLVDPKGLK
jgi:hypothetical protein